MADQQQQSFGLSAAAVWPISNSSFNGGRGVARVRQPRTDTERIEVSQSFVSDFGFETPMLVDSVANRLQ